MFPKVIEAAYNFAEESSLISLFKYVALASFLSDLLQPDLQPAIFSLGVKRDALGTVTCVDFALYLFTTDHVRLPQKREPTCQIQEEADAKNTKIKGLVLISFMMLQIGSKSVEVSWFIVE